MAETIKRYIRYTILSLRILGLYTDTEDFFGGRFYWIYSLFINVAILGLFNLSQVMYVIVNFQDTDSLLTHAYLTLTFVMPNVKAYFYLKNWSKIRKLVQQLDEEVFQPKNQRQVRLFDSFFRIQNFVHAAYLIMIANITILWPLIPLLGKNERSLPYPYWLPFDYKRPIVFELVYLHQSVGITCMTLVNITLDMITFGFTSFIATECEMLGDILVNLNDFTEERLEKERLLPAVLSAEERIKMVVDGAQDTLMYCIELHWKIIRFADDVNSFFTVLVFLQFGSSLLSICLTMYGLNLISSAVEMGICAIFMCGLLTELLFYCFFGHEIMTKSSELATALYHTPWVDCSKAFKENLLFFMLRVKTPIKMLALDFFEMALPTFIWILRSSWSFYTVLTRSAHKK